VKGAEPEIFRRNQDPSKYSDILEFISGLVFRSLCFASKIVENFAHIYVQHQTAAFSISEREIQIEKFSDQIERNLIASGITGVEDQL
jgi:hypothetical protein